MKTIISKGGHALPRIHCSDVIMMAMASQITSLMIIYSTVYSEADRRKHQSSTSLAFGRGIHRWPVNSPHKWPVTRKMCPFDDVIILWGLGVFSQHPESGCSWSFELDVCLCPHHPKMFSCSWISLKTFRPMPRLTPGHPHHRGMLAHRLQNWNHQHWSHVFVLFADKSKVSLYNCNGGGRMFRRVVQA